MDRDEEVVSGLGRLVQQRLARTRRAAGRWADDVRPERRHLRADLVAGLPGAISSVPDGMAAGVLAGVSPAHGLYAAVAGPSVGGLATSTRLMVVTTTSAAALAAGSAVSEVAPGDRSDAMLWLTLLVGVALLAAAAADLSRYIRFVSYSVMLGFLTGVAVNMVLGQVGDLLGIDPHGATAVSKALYCLRHLDQLHGPAALTGVGTLVLLVGLGRTRVAILASVVAIVVPSLAVALTDPSGVLLVSDTGTIPQGLPLPGIPAASAFDLSLVGGALAVAALVLVQGAGVAEAVPNPGGPRTSVRRDFSAQGLANLASGLIGGQPVGGSVGQTALNVTAGARSRWAAIWTGIWMAVILLTMSGLVGRVPMPSLAAVLVYAGVGSVRPREVLSVPRAGRIAALALGATFVAVLVLPVAAAVGAGVLVSLLLQLNQDALDLRVVRLVRRADGAVVEEKAPAHVVAGETVVLDVHGSLFYAGAHTLQHRLPRPRPATVPQDGAPTGPVVVLRLRGRPTLGATFLKVVGDYAHELAGATGQLYLSGLDPELVERWRRDGAPPLLGGVHLLPATPALGESTRAAVVDAHRVVAVDRDQS